VGWEVTEHYVLCRTCRTANGRNPKRWHWLCVDCAEQCADTHRREHPDHDIELRVTQEPSMDNLLSDIRGMSFSLKKRGW